MAEHVVTTVVVILQSIAAYGWPWRNSIPEHCGKWQNMAEQKKIYRNMCSSACVQENGKICVPVYGRTWRNPAEHGGTLQNVVEHCITCFPEHGRIWQNMEEQDGT